MSKATTTNQPIANTANIAAKQTTGKANKATTGKTKKLNPLKEARKVMLKSVREERISLGDCIRLLAMKGGNWLKEIKLTPKQFAALTPNDLRPFQLEKERYKAILIGIGGEAEKVESGWTPTKVANAVERMQAAKVVTVAAK